MVTKFTDEFINDAKTKRRFTPILPVTPFDNFYIEIGLKICDGVPPPPTLPWDTAIVTKVNDADIKVVSDGTFRLNGSIPSSPTSPATSTYRWKLNGWPGLDLSGEAGITTPFEQMTKFETMDLLVKNLKNEIAINLQLTDGEGTKFWEAIPFSGCVHIGGPTTARVRDVLMQGKSAGANAHSSVFSQLFFWNDAFGGSNGTSGIEPFRSYSAYLAAQADLYQYDDTGWPIETQGTYTFFTDNIYRMIPHQSFCKGARLYSFQNNRTYSAYTKKYYQTLFFAPNVSNQVRLHEMGHALCGLDDEYQRSEPPPSSTLSSLNCSTSPDIDYLLGGINYGNVGLDKSLGCAWNSTQSGTQIFRPTGSSIMRTSTGKFNEVSCGYCVAAITGQGTGKSHWPVCSSLDTVHPVRPPSQ